MTNAQVGLRQPLVQRQRRIRIRTADVQQRFQRHAARREVHRARLALCARRAEGGLAVAEPALAERRLIAELALAVRFFVAELFLTELLFAKAGLVAEPALAVRLFIAELFFAEFLLAKAGLIAELALAVRLFIAELFLTELLLAEAGLVAARLSVGISICAAETAVAPPVVCH